jgi:hypothetical protein
MTMPFASLMARTNALVMNRLANTEATLCGVAVTGILTAGHDDTTFAGPGAAGSSPSFVLAAASTPPAPRGLLLVIATGVAAGNYKVTYHEPDGTGLVTLYLTKA